MKPAYRGCGGRTNERAMFEIIELIKGYMRRVIKAKAHPQYNPSKAMEPVNDIALIKVKLSDLSTLFIVSTIESAMIIFVIYFKLDKPVIPDEIVSPICLPNPKQSIPDDGLAVVTGFGKANGFPIASSFFVFFIVV